MAMELLMGRAAFLSAATTAVLAVGRELRAADREPDAAIEVTPNEDLMREHGVLRRILLIHDEMIARLGGEKDVGLEPIARAARIVRTFVENYHERLEENHLFPRFEKAGVLADLVKVLREQHQAGRRLTDDLLKAAADGPVKDPARGRQVAEGLRRFCRMYRAHAAREDTVLFPAIRRVVTAKEYDVLGDAFEDQERERFGPDGFEKVVADVAAIEKTLGLDDLRRYTPAA